MFVDFFTTEKELEDLMLSKYQGRLFPSQIKKIEDDYHGTYVYSFFKVDYGKLAQLLLDGFDENREFMILQHGSRRLIEDNSNFINFGSTH